jgi:hypothetical protein
MFLLLSFLVFDAEAVEQPRVEHFVAALALEKEVKRASVGLAGLHE